MKENEENGTAQAGSNPGSETGGEAAGAKKEKGKSESGQQLKEIFNGTARLGKSIGQAFKGMADIFTGRDYVVMVRVNKMCYDKIDELVESGLFKSRSESAAYLLARGIQADEELFSRIQNRVSEINRLKDELKDMVQFDEKIE